MNAPPPLLARPAPAAWAWEPLPAFCSLACPEDSAFAGGGGQRIGILVLAHNAAATLEQVLHRIPPRVWSDAEEVAVFDDASPDATCELAARLGCLLPKLSVRKHARNLGHGGNQKAGYRYFLDRGFDIVVLLQGDGQYAPEILADLYHPIASGDADAVLGSRMIPVHGGPLKGGMPLYEYLGNRVLACLENRALGMHLSEFPSGYFRQHVEAAGNQIILRPFNEPGQLPLTPLRGSDGEWLRIPIQLPGFRLLVRTWQVQVGRTKLYLLDTNDPSNLPEHRGITAELYGGGPEVRLQQELVLGIGGWRLLRSLGIYPEVCHLNEGHSAFVVLERARSYGEDTGQPFSVALAVTRAGNLFTTHTPVAAGFDRFAPELMADRMRNYAEQELGISLGELLALGRLDPSNGFEPFNMAYLAIRGSGAVNGVSRLHGEVSRRIFQPLFPRWPVREVPVGHVTNGVHTASWDSPEADELWTSVCGKGHWLGTDLKVIEEKMRGVPDAVLWNMRQRARRSMISYLRRRLARQLAGHGALKQEIEQARGVLDPDALTMGFARRFASYKRPNLLLHDRDRLLRILTNTVRPVQLVIAGKAHPHDAGGQEMIRQWVEFIRHTSARSQAVFLSDDDMGLTERLVQGIDLWLNTPQRPWEASGTSGMKVLVNGGLNFSELDGWWAEAYSPEVGWALGDGCEHAEDAAWDAHEADQLYTLLEREIVPEFYDRDEPGIPAGWIAKMRESMARLTPQFSAIRQMREYTEQHYLPLAHHFLRRSRDDGRAGAGIVEWQRQVEQHWSRMRFGSLKVSTDAGRHTFAVQVWLNELASDAVTVELFAEGLSDKAPVRCSMTQGKALVGSENGHTWTATVPADRPAEDFTPRLLPRHEGAMVPLECPRILWYR